MSRVVLALVVAMLACGSAEPEPKPKPKAKPTLDRGIGEPVNLCISVEQDYAHSTGTIVFVELATRDRGGEPIGEIPAGARTQATRESQHGYLVRGWNPYTDAKSVGWISKAKAKPCD